MHALVRREGAEPQPRLNGAGDVAVSGRHMRTSHQSMINNVMPSKC